MPGPQRRRHRWGTGRPVSPERRAARQQAALASPLVSPAGEAIGAPVSYCSVECGGSEERSYRVYLLSEDGGRSYRESGRCPLEEGPFCCTGFPDGRIVGLTCPDRNAGGTGGGDGILVRSSLGGRNPVFFSRTVSLKLSPKRPSP